MTSHNTLKINNPYTGLEIDSIPFASAEQLRSTLDTATATFRAWKTSQAWERAQLLEDAANQLRSERQAFAELICREAGKPLTYALVEVDRALSVLSWAAAEAKRFSGELLRLDTTPSGRPGFGIHSRFPRGVILGITPFNFPLNLVAHKIAPAIASGCSIIIKPSPATPLTAIRFAGLFASRRPGLFQVLICNDDDAANLTLAPEIAMISFTGSARIGQQIRRQACEKPMTLELGGNAWSVVSEDTPESAFPAICKRIIGAAFGYAGQSCISVQNLAVAESIWPTFIEQLKTATRSCAFGNPEDPSVVSSAVIKDQAAIEIRRTLTVGSRGCEIVSSENSKPGNTGTDTKEHQRVIPPTLVINPDEQSPLVQEEVFGPVMTARPFRNNTDLITLINSSRYGLQTGIYTQNFAVIEHFYRDLDVGGVIVNDVPSTRYDHQPYGGVKSSGEGREGIRYAMEEMTYTKFLGLSSVVI